LAACCSSSVYGTKSPSALTPYRPLITAAKNLHFLVLDELHTYRGRQGADVARLARRTREVFTATHLQCVGTSATLAGAGTYEAQRAEVAKRPTVHGPEFIFLAHSVEDLHDEQRRFTLATEDLALLNPNTRTCPVFRCKHDAELTKAIYRRVPVLIKEGPSEENPWGIRFSRMFDMSNDSSLFRTREQLEATGWSLDGNVFRGGHDVYLPLYEGRAPRTSI
jgi:hypothetical protein